MENRPINSFVCQGQGSEYTLPSSTPYEYDNGNYDTAILEIIENSTGRSILFFKQTLSICTVEPNNCNQINDGRGANNEVPYVRLFGQIMSCDNSTIQTETIILYPTSGQTLVELQLQILEISNRN